MIDDQLLSAIHQILSNYKELQNARLFIFGSRATGKNRKFSDIDLGIQADKPLSLSTLVRIEEQFEESNIPYTVDVIDFSLVNGKFKDVAFKKIIPLN